MQTYLKNLFERIPNYARYLVAGGIALSLVFIFPTNAKFKYRFSMGQTWLYDDLIANIDFAIKKTDEEIAADRAAIEKDLSPYYEIDLDVLKDRKKAFAKAFDEQLRRTRAQSPDVVKNVEMYLNYGNTLLERVYTRGILKPDTLLQRKDKDFIINILRGNTTETQTLQSLYTPQKAYEWISDSLKFTRLKEPFFILSLLDEAFLKPNLAFNAEKTKEFHEQELEKISTSRGMVKSGELIVRKGGIINEATYQKLISYKEQYESDYQSSRKYFIIVLGYVLLTTMVLGLFLFYLRYHAPQVFVKLRWIVFLLGWVVLYSYLVYGIKASDVLNSYMVPFCIAPIVIRNFYNRELAFVSHLVIVLVVGLITSPGYEFIFLQMVAGIVIVFSRFDTRYWGNFFQSIFFISLVYCVGFVGLSLVEEPSVRNINWSVLVWMALNGFLTLLAYPLIPLLGGFFGFTSSITLAELSDLNHPLLKELSLKAPGTLQHSLQVANLSEAAAKAVGADDLLIKVAALYHDIGKTLKPFYFIENQAGKNPHDDLTHLESAKVIIEHVTEGAKLAARFGLPPVVTDFILTHHGTTLVEYFYRLYVRDNPNGANDRLLFQYPGPKPRTKEESILMLADSLEATAKSLRHKDSQTIDDLVDRIVADKIAQGQFEHSDLSFADLEKCKVSFKQTLKNIHHVRIEYPSVAATNNE